MKTLSKTWAWEIWCAKDWFNVVDCYGNLIKIATKKWCSWEKDRVVQKSCEITIGSIAEINDAGQCWWCMKLKPVGNNTSN